MTELPPDPAFGSFRGCSRCTPERACDYHAWGRSTQSPQGLIDALMALERFGFAEGVRAPDTHIATKRWLDADDVEAILRAYVASARTAP